MFRGSNSATLDGKGRMALPTRTRETLSGLSENKVVVTIDMREPCLLLYPLSDWEVVQGKLESLSNINPQARLLQRLLIGHATDLQLDGAGRLLLPSMLRDFAQLEKKLVLVGQGNKIEIWSEQNWQQRMGEWVEEGANALAENADMFDGLSV
ncbi:MAG: division/cell wall cluster transcriptional repressor MraZ [Pseudomonadales bacterium]|jgi:MraZ protein|nr:division/cell wall cluster transcriptional repressor MraZ [Pseudomonadales bacterium]|tara:strand:+ start:268 stop:726 length:459 start_codon:yes stop_codon:yes gene_type:complete